MRAVRTLTVALLALSLAGQAVAQTVTPATAASAAPAYRLAPANTAIAAFGDSRINLCYSAGLTDQMVRGVCYWVGFLSNQRYSSAFADNYGVAGDGTTQLLARLNTALQTQASVVLISDPTNDYTSVATATTIANMTTIFQAFRDAGKIVITWAPTPRSGANVLSATALNRQSNYGSWLRANAASLGVYVADATPDLYDNTQAGFADKTNTTADGLHFNVNGAYLMAKAIVAVLDTIYRPQETAVFNNGDLYNATDNPRGNLISNGAMLGTGGTYTSPVGGATVTGSLPTGWTLNIVNGTGVTVALSVVTSGKYSCAQAVISGTPSAGGLTFNFRQSLSAANIAQGDKIVPMARIEVDAGATNIQGLGVQSSLTDAGGQHFITAGNYVTGVGAIPSVAFAGTTSTGQPNIVGATPTAGYISLQALATQNIATSGTIRFCNASLKKVM